MPAQDQEAAPEGCFLPTSCRQLSLVALAACILAVFASFISSEPGAFVGPTPPIRFSECPPTSLQYTYKHIGFLGEFFVDIKGFRQRNGQTGTLQFPQISKQQQGRDAT